MHVVFIHFYASLSCMFNTNIASFCIFLFEVYAAFCYFLCYRRMSVLCFPPLYFSVLRIFVMYFCVLPTV